jgi:hypothetical protein
MNQKLRNPLLISAAFAALSLGGLTGCVVREEAPAPVAVTGTPAPADGDEIANDAPPADVEEVQPPQPGPEFVWVGGYYGWFGGRYAWHRGYWRRPPYGYHVWVRDRWVYGPRGYVHVRGHWG